MSYANQLIIENTNLEKELQQKQSDFNKYDRVNFYYSQDEVMFVFIQKILTILYAVIYFVFIYFLYSNPEKYGKLISIFILFVFALLPFLLHIVSRFLYTIFLMILHAIYNGNSNYLYMDSKVPSDQN